MANLTQFGNDLYTGKRSYDFVGKYRLWYMIAIVGMAISIVIPIVNGFNFGIEFRGGSQFQITEAANPEQQPAIDAVQSVAFRQAANVDQLGVIPLVDVKAQYAPFIPELKERFAEVLESGRFIFGPEVEAFERESAAYLGVPHAIGVANAP